ncbi:MAG: acetate--CoA ligase family protein [Proteobacteria bacterium]|nr:acetate--CoA ligase family protein [Pseudomonadota bacterium]
MDFFFNPKGVAVIGASANPLKGGYTILKNLISGYKGAIYPVNPGYDAIEGLTCYPDIKGVPDPLDLVILFIPAKMVPSVVSDCANRGVKGVIIQSGGFAESGGKGQAIQEELLSVMKKTGIRLWGPNCMGLVDTVRKNVFSFVSPAIWEQEFIKSDVSLIVQSGMLSAGFLIDLMSHGTMGISKACSIGNKIDVDECDVLEYLINDPDTGTIGLYLESITDGRRFFHLLKHTDKPVVVLKGGKSEKGAEAAMSHTASLAGDGKVISGALAQAGVIEARDFKQMMDLLRTVSMYKHLPALNGKNIIVLTYSGAAGILSSDFIDEMGLKLADIKGETAKLMQSVFPDWMPVSNPVDMWPAIEKNGRKKVYGTAFLAAIADPGIHGILFHSFISKGAKKPDADVFRELARHAGKPIVCWSMGHREDVMALNMNLQEAGIPVFGELYRSIECLAVLVNRKQKKKAVSSHPSTATRPVLWEKTDALIKDQHGVLDEFASKKILSSIGIPVVSEQIVQSEKEVLRSIAQSGFPVVMKGLVPQTVHKSDHGLVELNIYSEDTAIKTFRSLSEKMAGKGDILIQKQINGHVELIAGFVRDPQFGPCVMIGFGGMFAELIKDTAFALAPLTFQDAIETIDRLKTGRLLDGYRGMAPLDKNDMANILIRIGELGITYPWIKEIDINPLIVDNGHPVAVDASVILG